ncbi:Membrane protein insertase YidC [Castellaniella denitrificans]
MDIRRTILWMIFSFSLLLLWNNWQVYQGHPSLFSLTPPAAEQSKTAKSGDGHPSTGVPAATAAQPGAPATVPGSSAKPQGQKVHLKTDVYDLTFDTTGAQLVQAELLRYKSLKGDDAPMYLLNDQPGDIYVAQTGVVGAPQGSGYPTHLTPFSLVTPEPVAKGDTVEIAFEATAGQVKVVKTFIVPRDGYDIRVRHDITNLGDQPIDPSLYLQLTRDGNDPPNTSGFYSTFTGAAVYSSEDKFQKVKFDEIAKGKASYIHQADNGWIGIVQHYFASAWVPPQGTVRTNQALRLADNLYAIRTIEQVGTIAPGAQRSVEANLWVGPQDQRAMSALGLDFLTAHGCRAGYVCAPGYWPSPAGRRGRSPPGWRANGTCMRWRRRAGICRPPPGMRRTAIRCWTCSPRNCAWRTRRCAGSRDNSPAMICWERFFLGFVLENKKASGMFRQGLQNRRKPA